MRVRRRGRSTALRYSAMALRLQAQLKGSHELGAIANAPVPPVKGYVDERSVKTEESFTPGGLPLRLYAHFRDDWGEIVVVSVESELLRASVHVNSHIEFRLPTDEILQVAVLNH
jgi:hypothetical protein